YAPAASVAASAATVPSSKGAPALAAAIDRPGKAAATGSARPASRRSRRCNLIARGQGKGERRRNIACAAARISRTDNERPGGDAGATRRVRPSPDCRARMPMPATPPLVWEATIALIIGLLAFDYFFHVRKAHAPTLREAAVWSAMYVGFALLFGAAVWTWGGADMGAEYFSGYITEKALSIDNVFVFLV